MTVGSESSADCLVLARIESCGGIGIPHARMRVTVMGTAPAAPAVFLGESQISGHVMVGVDLPGKHEARGLVRISCGGYGDVSMEVRLDPGATVELGDLVLRAGGALQGRVVDANDVGVPGAVVCAIEATEGAEFSVRDAALTGPPGILSSPACRTDANGAFFLGGVPEGSYSVWAWSADCYWSYQRNVIVRGQSTPADVVLTVRPLEDRMTIKGVVLSPAGERVYFARISAIHEGARRRCPVPTHTNQKGEFQLVLRQAGRHTVVCSDTRGRWSDVFTEGVDGTAGALELNFGEPRALIVCGEASGGASIGDSRLLVRVEAMDERLTSFFTRKPVTASSGSPDCVRVLEPEIPFLLTVSASGFGEVVLGPYSPHAAPDRLLARLSPLPQIAGRVLRNAVTEPGCTVSLVPVLETNDVQYIDGFRCKYGIPVSKTVTSADGEFRLSSSQRSGEYIVVVSSAGGFAAEFGPLWIHSGEGIRGLTIPMEELGTLAGQVRSSDGRSVAGMVLGISRGDGKVRTVRLDRDGKYVFHGLLPGAWEVRVPVKDIMPATHYGAFGDDDTKEVEVDHCEVSGGRKTTYDFLIE